MKRTEPQSIAKIISDAINQAGMTDTVVEQRALYLWPEIVGHAVNRYTFKRYMAPGGEMHVYITSAVLKNELSFHRSRIVELINQALGREVVKTLIIH